MEDTLYVSFTLSQDWVLLLDAEDAACQEEKNENSGTTPERRDDVHLCFNNDIS
jgi:hypothetical protein